MDTQAFKISLVDILEIQYNPTVKRSATRKNKSHPGSDPELIC